MYLIEVSNPRFLARVWVFSLGFEFFLSLSFLKCPISKHALITLFYCFSLSKDKKRMLSVPKSTLSHLTKCITGKRLFRGKRPIFNLSKLCARYRPGWEWNKKQIPPSYEYVEGKHQNMSTGRIKNWQTSKLQNLPYFWCWPGRNSLTKNCALTLPDTKNFNEGVTFLTLCTKWMKICHQVILSRQFWPCQFYANHRLN